MSLADLASQVQGWADQVDRDLVDLRDLHQRLRQDFDDFKAQFQYGRTFVSGLLWKLVYEGTVTVPTGGPHNLPATPIESLYDLQHAFYDLSAFQQTTDGEGVLYAGTVSVFPANSVTVAIERRYETTAPAHMETYLSWYNNKASDVNVVVKVYRQVGRK